MAVVPKIIAGIRVCTVDEWDPTMLDSIKLVPTVRGSTRKAAPDNRPRYLDLITAFDIETSRFPFLHPEQSVMYIWQFAVTPQLVIIGRTWDEFLQLITQISGRLELRENELLKKGAKRNKVRILCFVHNLSYEFSFLHGIWEFRPKDVFALEPRKILKCNLGPLEMRCSFLQSNLSLAQFTKKFGAAHVKRSGEEFDYSRIRLPWTPMTDKELEYCIVDVVGLIEAMRIQMEHDGDTQETLPLTSTGYVRRDAKKAMAHFNSRQVFEMQPGVEVYTALREAFRGGNTHANRYYAGEILENVSSTDRSSSYPDVIVNDRFPMRPFWHKGPCSLAYYERNVGIKEYAALLRISMSGNVRLRDRFCGCPYLTTDKCRNLLKCSADNGRVLRCNYLETTCTDVDFRIIRDQYVCDDLQITDSWYAAYGPLPQSLRDLVIRYYKRKTELRGNVEMRLYYEKDKAKINSSYGLMAQDPVRWICEWEQENHEYDFHEPNLETALRKNQRKNFLCYQWGVWVTAWARYWLQRGIDLCGDSFVYADTDSVKYLGTVDFEPLNDELAERSWRNGGFAVDSRGEVHYMGVFETEGCSPRFSTLGAKKYVYEDAAGQLHITIAGVHKTKGAAELTRMGGISAFKEGITFVEAGGTASTFNDDPLRDGVTGRDGLPLPAGIRGPVLEIDGHQLEITSNQVITDSTYTLGITQEYWQVLENSYILKLLYESLEWY